MKDKIVVAPHQIDDYDLDIQSVGHNGAEEYIRKEALLDWLEECKNNPAITDLQKGNIQELIDKINSL